MAPPRIGKIRYRPVLVVTWPATIEVTVTPSIIGVRASPLMVGDSPWTVCWYSGRNVIAPNMARPVRKVSAMVSEKFRFLNTCSGRIGSATRSSTTQNPAVAATASTAEADDLGRGPRVLGAAPGGQQDERGRGHGEQHAAEVVDPVADPLGGQVQGGHDVDQGRPADRQVDVEDPAPGEAWW